MSTVGQKPSFMLLGRVSNGTTGIGVTRHSLVLLGDGARHTVCTGIAEKTDATKRTVAMNPFNIPTFPRPPMITMICPTVMEIVQSDWHFIR